MTNAKRFLNVKAIAIVAALLFLVACYFAVRKVTASDIELGMDRATVYQKLGGPIQWYSWDVHSTAIWQQTILSYSRTTIIMFNQSDKVDEVRVENSLFGLKHTIRRQN
jgi:hypothetical protein